MYKRVYIYIYIYICFSSLTDPVLYSHIMLALYIRYICMYICMYVYACIYIRYIWMHKAPAGIKKTTKQENTTLYQLS